jgi:hypothetical protein
VRYGNDSEAENVDRAEIRALPFLPAVPTKPPFAAESLVFPELSSGLASAETVQVKELKQAVKGGRGASSRFKGVRWEVRSNKWTASINRDGKSVHLGSFQDDADAARKYDQFAAPLGRDLNFPGPGQAAAVKTGHSSTYRGVCWHAKISKWRADIRRHGKNETLGYFDSEEEAARHYDEAAAPLGRPVNFLPSTHGHEAILHKPQRARAKVRARLSTFVDACAAVSAVTASDRSSGASSSSKARSRDDSSVGSAASSRYTGVSWFGSTKKWKAQANLRGKNTYLGSFNSEEEAARKYDDAVRPLGRPLNFPNPTERGASGGGVASSAAVGAVAARQGSSSFKGVSWNLASCKWLAQIRVRGKKMYLGNFDDEQEAAHQVDAHAAPLGRPLNFPAGPHAATASAAAAAKAAAALADFVRVQAPSPTAPLSQADAPFGEDEDPEEVEEGKRSAFKGVTWFRKTNKWMAALYVGKKRTHLGYFDDEEEAARKYDEAAAPLGKPTNFLTTRQGDFLAAAATAALAAALSAAASASGAGGSASSSSKRKASEVEVSEGDVPFEEENNKWV